MQSTQSHFTDMSTQFLRKQPNRRSDLRAVAAIKHPHLSIVQVFKEPPLPQRDRDSDKPYRFRQPPPLTFFAAGDPLRPFPTPRSTPGCREEGRIIYTATPVSTPAQHCCKKARNGLRFNKRKRHSRSSRNACIPLRKSCERCRWGRSGACR